MSVRVITGSVLLAALLGLSDAIYLAIHSMGGAPVVCNVIDGCSIVLESRWATVLGIPTALYGVGYYSLLVLLSAAGWFWQDQATLWFAFGVSSVGLVISAGLVYVQIFQIQAVCEYCMISAFLTTVIWVGLGWLLKTNRPGK